MPPALAMALSLLATMPAHAKDYGMAGPTWAIAEPDLLEVIRARLLRAQGNGELAALNRKFVGLAEARARRPVPVGGITPAREDRRWSFDPTVTIGEDIHDQRGRLVAAKGQSFNPLDHLSLAHELAFVDGDSPAEMAWAAKQGDAAKVWIVMVKGSPLDQMKALKRRFFFDQAGELTGKFGILHTPALVRQQGRVLDVSEVALPREGGA